MIVFDAGKPLLLSCCHDVAIDDQTSRGIMIERGYTENACHVIPLTVVVRTKCK